MFKPTFIGAIALVALCAASVAAVREKPLPPIASFAGRLVGPVGSGYFEYTEWPGGDEMRQRLHIVVREYEPLASLPVWIDGQGVATITTDWDGFADVSFWNPPVWMPRMRPGSVIAVGDLVGKVAGK